MSSAIEVAVKETEPVVVAFITVKGSYAQIPGALGQLYGWIGERGYVPAGPPVGVYFDAPGQVPEDRLRWELRSPISGDVQPDPTDARGLGVRTVESTLVASTVHKGPFQTIGRTYGALASWIAANGYEIAGPCEEVYFTDPAEVPPEELVTEVRFPVREAQ